MANGLSGSAALQRVSGGERYPCAVLGMDGYLSRAQDRQFALGVHGASEPDPAYTAVQLPAVDTSYADAFLGLSTERQPATGTAFRCLGDRGVCRGVFQHVGALLTDSPAVLSEGSTFRTSALLRANRQC